MEALKDILVLALLVYMFRKRIQTGHVFVISAILFGVLHYISPLKLVSLFFASAASRSTLAILAALYLITLLEKVMRKSGSQGKLVSGLMHISGDPRISMAALPAIIGLLPSPGGARFSAPLVKEASKDIEITGEQNAAINYYYRHLWEYFLPLYPASLLAVEILHVPLEKFVLVMLPFTIFTAFAGILLFRGFPAQERSGEKISPTAGKQVFEGLAPIAFIMVLALVFKVHILAALIIAILFMFIYYKITPREIGPMLAASLEIKLMYMFLGAIFLREVLVQSGSIDLLLSYFHSIGLSPLLIAIILPMTIGLLTGLTLAGATISLPVIVSLAGPDNLLSLGSLAFASIIVGLMLSPMHLCLLMSIEHFAADFGKTYVKLILPEIIILLFAIVYAYILPF